MANGVAGLEHQRGLAAGDEVGGGRQPDGAGADDDDRLLANGTHGALRGGQGASARHRWQLQLYGRSHLVVNDNDSGSVAAGRRANPLEEGRRLLEAAATYSKLTLTS
jgi:hypothetical protein